MPLTAPGPSGAGHLSQCHEGGLHGVNPSFDTARLGQRRCCQAFELTKMAEQTKQKEPKIKMWMEHTNCEKKQNRFMKQSLVKRWKEVTNQTFVENLVYLT